jgi:type I restriction-modification system DNA methylase subunit
MSEADIHFELYRYLASAIEDSPSRGNVRFSTVRPEYSEGISGRADLVLFDDNEDPILVIEAKRPGEETVRQIDPYSPDVMEQVLEYGVKLGAEYCATYNGDRLVLFQTLEPGKPFLERPTKSYEIRTVEKFASELLDEVARFRERSASWDNLDDAFITRVRSLHDHVAPELNASFEAHLETDEQFRGSFKQWAGRQGTDFDAAGSDDREEIISEFAKQASYVLINRILFYKILEQAPAYTDDIPPLAVSIHRVREDLNDFFETVVSNVDFEAIFEHDSVFSEIPLESVARRIRDFILELDDQDLTQFDSDVIGRIYEGVIPEERRREMGEYYTPPAVCDLITELTIDDAADTVLDPGCGSGGFLISAYHRLDGLLAESTASHSRVLSQLHGFDINRFPAHLTAINLAIQDLGSFTDNVNIEVSDFFNISPDSFRFRREAVDTGGSSAQSGLVQGIGKVDAVVGNPPYIRGRDIAEKSRVRDHLSEVDGEFISRRMDVYGYFISHSTTFLTDGGRLGFITSDRWLDTGYGADLQQFILDHYKVDAIIKFDTQTFADALVGASILLLTKEPKERERDANTVKFLRIREPMQIDEIASVVRQDLNSNKMVNDPEYRLITQHQVDLCEQEKWNVHFLAPPVYFDIIGHSDIIELQDIANLESGHKSGANKFFFAKKQDWEDLGLNDYTMPLLKATGQLSRIRFDEDDAQEWGCLDINSLIETASESISSRYEDVDMAEAVKKWLLEQGHRTLVDYIEQGEEKGFHERPSTSSRDVWFSLGELERPDIVMTDFTWRVNRTVWNQAKATSTNQFYNLSPKEQIPEKVLGGILNSRLAWLMVELQGRRAGGQGMTRARIALYEAEGLCIPNPTEMTRAEKQRIVDAFEELMQREDELQPKERSVQNTENARAELDRAVLATLDMEDRFEELKQAISRLVGMREQDAGEKTEVLVNRPDEREVIELEGVYEARESTTLSDF